MILRTDADYAYYNHCQAVATVIVDWPQHLAEFAELSKHGDRTIPEIDLAVSLEPEKYTNEEWWAVLTQNNNKFKLLDDRISAIILTYIENARNRS